MHQEVSLIATAAIGFVLASIFGYFADRLRLPPLVGYLIAGIVMGPGVPGFVADTALAGQLAEMGVILLMFGVGLHFSASDLLAVKGIAVPGAVLQIAFATLLGIGICHLWGWSLGAGIVMGLSLSVASTVVLLKALEERNLVNTANGRVTVGWLIVEDLAMVLALVLLPAFAEVLGGHGDASAGHDAGGDASIAIALLLTLAKVAAFAILAIVFGPKLLPRILTQVARTGSRELFTLTVLALALGIAYGAAEIFGVSFALGAFIAGVVLSESHLSHKAASESLPLQDAFSVLFFVSVGLLFDPSVVIQKPGEVLAVLALIIVGKGLAAFLIVFLLRYPIGMGLMVAAGLAQIGEFSFILAGLGIAYGLMPEEGRDLLLAGALLSITLNPAVIYAAGEAQKLIRSRWPAFYASYGREKQEVLTRELNRIRERSEERENARQSKIHELLETFPLFARIDKHDQDELLLLFRPKEAAPGERVIRVGERGNAMYFISSGAVEVSVGESNIRLKAGAFFGEMALLSGERRIADVTAVDFCQFLVLERRDFNQFMAKHPEVREVVDEMARQRKAMNQARIDGRAGEAEAT